MKTRRRFRLLVVALASGLSLAVASRGHAKDADSVFGSSSKGEGGALIGILYDLKQTQQRQPTKETPASYRGVITEFLKSGWDEEILNRYFRVTRPLYTTRIWIPMMNADEAPKAFGVADVVKPRMWVVHYKGQVAPPESGLYRFSGMADDIIAVRVNDRLVLVSGRPDCLPPASVWKSPEPKGRDGTTSGDWIALKAGETVDMDVIVGERPGGRFGAELSVEKQGEPTSGRKPPMFSLGAGPAAGTAAPAWSVWQAKQ